MPQVNKMSLINCKNLELAYDNKTVLRNLSFEIDHGTISVFWAKTAAVKVH